MKQFTLLELLIVLAIIALLASLLLPSMSNARNTAKAAVCKSNMRHIGIAIELFKKANNQRLPKAVMAESTTWSGMGNYQAWKSLINPFLKQNEVTSSIIEKF